MSSQLRPLELSKLPELRTTISEPSTLIVQLVPRAVSQLERHVGNTTAASSVPSDLDSKQTLPSSTKVPVPPHANPISPSPSTLTDVGAFEAQP